MNYKYVIKRLKHQYKCIEEMGYNVFCIFPESPQPYSTFLYNKEKVDSICVVIPSKSDISEYKSLLYYKYLEDTQEKIILMDIRHFICSLINQRFSILESLYKNMVINKEYDEYIKYLQNIKNEITSSNPVLLFEHLAYLVNMCVYELDIIGFIANKQEFKESLYQLIRLKNVIINLINKYTFKDSLFQFEDKDLNFITSNNIDSMKFEDIEPIIKEYRDIVLESLGTLHKDELQKQITLSTQYKLNTLLKNILFDEYNKNNSSINKKPNLNKYKNIYLTSDMHFGHINILQYEDRINTLKVNTIEEHDKKLIDNWNSTVNKKDLVIILGDIGFYTPIKLNKIIKQLNGDKILIAGNHDSKYVKSKVMDKSLFKYIDNYLELNYKGYNICLMHYPLLSFNGMHNEKSVHFFGHIHTAKYTLPRHSYHIGVDTNNYKPIHIDKAIELALLNNGSDDYE